MEYGTMIKYCTQGLRNGDKKELEVAREALDARTRGGVEETKSALDTSRDIRIEQSEEATTVNIAKIVKVQPAPRIFPASWWFGEC